MNIARVLALFVIAALLTSPTDLASCGPFLLTTVFTWSRQPDSPETNFAKGDLGILLPTFQRAHMIVAYRYLTGHGLSPDERKALFPAVKPEQPQRWVQEWGVSIPPVVDEWLAARQKVAGAGQPAKIDVYRQQSTATAYDGYLNCSADAFHSAAITLLGRIGKPPTAELLDWVHGQDDVFANCSGGPVIPKPTPPSASPWLHAARAYQIAAAQFYAGDLDKAEDQFRKIAADPASPWRGMSSYLLARCAIRRATIQNKPEALASAQTQLEAILKDQAQQALHPAATSLLNFVHARLDPDGRLHELPSSITAKIVPQDFSDYLFLFNKVGDQDADDLTHWLATFRDPLPPPDHAVELWRKSKSLPWLVAAISEMHSGDPAESEVLHAAESIKPESPGYETIEFHRVRLLEESEKFDDARKRLDALLTGRKLSASSRNLILAERMRAAESWETFLKYSPRVAVGSGFDYDDEVLSKLANGRPIFDSDSTRIWNRQIPLRLMKDAATGTVLPAPLRADIALAAWVRAVLLDDTATAGQLAPVVVKTRPELKLMSDPRKFVALYLMLKNPGLRPYIETGFGRVTPLGKLNDFRDNWWCSFAEPKAGSGYDYRISRSKLGHPLALLYGTAEPEAAFLADSDRAEASAEWTKLAALATAPDYLAAQMVDYAKAHPEDPLAPEALHLAVRATRYGCTSDDTGTQSEAAFQLLHDRYPKSEWSAKTKYWFR